MGIPYLEDNRAKLIPLETFHYRDLLPLSREVDLYKYGPSDISSARKLKSYIEEACEKRLSGQALPFIIFDKEKQCFAGSTRFGHLDKKNKVLHIGWTWLGAKFRGSGLNQHVKFLMLKYAFESLSYQKVEFRIDARNQASRKSLEKMGITLEGILRSNLIVKDGRRRDTACYGVIRSEWKQVKETIANELTS